MITAILDFGRWIAPHVATATIAVISALLAVRFNWDIEQRRARLLRRQASVDSWRAMLRDWPHDNGLLVVGKEGLPLAKHADYPSLREILPAGLRKDIEGVVPTPNGRDTPDAVVTVGGGHRLRTHLMDAIADKEREWKLI